MMVEPEPPVSAGRADVGVDGRAVIADAVAAVDGGEPSASVSRSAPAGDPSLPEG